MACLVISGICKSAFIITKSLVYIYHSSTDQGIVNTKLSFADIIKLTVLYIEIIQPKNVNLLIFKIETNSLFHDDTHTKHFLVYTLGSVEYI